jgi:hypothetical protein
MSLCLKYAKDSTRKLLHLINIVSKIAGYKNNVQKLVAFLHINKEHTGKEIRKTIPVIVVSKKLK